MVIKFNTLTPADTEKKTQDQSHYHLKCKNATQDNKDYIRGR